MNKENVLIAILNFASGYRVVEAVDNKTAFIFILVMKRMVTIVLVVNSAAVQNFVG